MVGKKDGGVASFGTIGGFVRVAPINFNAFCYKKYVHSSFVFREKLASKMPTKV